jgi:hypothetical protein
VTALFRLIGFLVMSVVGLGGYLAIDYNMAKRWSGSEDSEGLTFTEYLGGFSERIAGLAASSGTARGLPTELAEMLPKPPEGWTIRPATKGDLDDFLPKKRSAVPKKALTYLEAIVTPASGKVESVEMTYEKGDQKVVFQLVRYPNIIFTSFMAMQQRFELQMRTAEFSGTQFMTVRGLDVSEDLLPEEVRARLFFASVGAQIHLRVLAPERMKDKDMVPFFQTLHVAAMNADVVDKQDGLGEVPVIVLASVLDEVTRAAYEADLAQRSAELAMQAEEERIKAEEKAAAEAARAASDDKGGGLFSGLFGSDPEEGETLETSDDGSITCKKGVGGSKKCAVTSPAPEE